MRRVLNQAANAAVKAKGTMFAVVYRRLIPRLGHTQAFEESLRGLQLELLHNPEAGDVEPGTSGLRKVRLGDPTRGKGKRGGARVHYLWLPHRSRIYLMLVYGKNEASTLTADQKKKLREIVAQIKATESPKE